MSRTIFVTRHAGALEWARRRDIAAEIVPHLDPAALSAGDVVIGTLPIHIVAQLCAKGVRYRHLAMEIPQDERGKDIGAEDMERFGARLEDFYAYERPAPARDATVAEREKPPSWLARHKSLQGVALAAAVSGSISWLGAAGAGLFSAVYPDAPPSGAGLLAGAAARVRQWLAPHVDQTVGARFVDFAPALVATVLASWALFAFSKKILRPQIASRRAEPSRGSRAVVMALSELKGDENLALARQAATMPIDAVCTAKWSFSMNWQQNARALRHHLAPGRKLIVYLVCSAESNKQFDLFRAFVEGLAESVGARVDLRLAVGGIVDFDDYAAVESRFRETLESLRTEERLKFGEICVDATSGTKVISIAAAVATMNHEVEFSYVSNRGDVRLFDARLPIAGRLNAG